MPSPLRVIAFLTASPFELLDLTGPAAVFSIPSTKGKHNYSLQILSTTSGSSVRSTMGITIANACKFDQYAGPIDTLIAIGGEGSIEHQSPELLNWLRKRSSHVRRPERSPTHPVARGATSADRHRRWRVRAATGRRRARPGRARPGAARSPRTGRRPERPGRA